MVSLYKFSPLFHVYFCDEFSYVHVLLIYLFIYLYFLFYIFLLFSLFFPFFTTFTTLREKTSCIGRFFFLLLIQKEGWARGLVE